MEPLLRLVMALMRIVSWIARPIFWMISGGKTVPPISNEILFISAGSLADKIRRRELRSEDVVKAYIARIQEVNCLINAVVECRYCEAVLEAKAIDSYLDSIQNQTDALENVQRDQPLLGVPLTVKESCSLKGMSICTGSVARKGLKAEVNGGSVSKLITAGAIPLLVSNTPEYCMFWETNNLVTGCTKNPYNTSYTVGGSSGGEGALLGAGASLLGIGSDFCGSIRLPALFNGVFGHKTSTYATPIDGHFPDCDTETLRRCFTIGPMARYADDLMLMMKVMSGPMLKLDEPVDLKTLNVYYQTDAESSITFTPVDKDIKNAISNSANYLRDSCGAKLHDDKFNFNDICESILSLMTSIEDIPNIIKDNSKNHCLALEFIKSICNKSDYSKNGLSFTLLTAVSGFVPKGKEEYYESILDKIKANLMVKLKNNGVLLFPTFPTSAYQHYEFLLKSSGIMYLGIFNVLGFPCTHVPMGLNKKGLPIGFQVVSTPFNDRLCLAVAKELEKGFHGWTAPKRFDAKNKY